MAFKRDKNDGESPRDCYMRKREEVIARVKNGDLVFHSEFDYVFDKVVMGMNHKTGECKQYCLTCGNHSMDDAMTPYECRMCAIKRVGQEEYQRRIDMQIESLQNYEEKKGKRPNHSAERKEEITSVEDSLPF